MRIVPKTMKVWERICQILLVDIVVLVSFVVYKAPSPSSSLELLLYGPMTVIASIVVAILANDDYRKLLVVNILVTPVMLFVVWGVAESVHTGRIELRWMFIRSDSTFHLTVNEDVGSFILMCHNDSLSSYHSRNGSAEQYLKGWKLSDSLG